MQNMEQKKLAPPDLPPDLEAAEVMSLDSNRILVAGKINDHQNKDDEIVRVVISVNQSTQYLIHEGENKYRQGRIEDLKIGTKVKVWHRNMREYDDPTIADMQTDGECIVYEKFTVGVKSERGYGQLLVT